MEVDVKTIHDSCFVHCVYDEKEFNIKYNKAVGSLLLSRVKDGSIVEMFSPNIGFIEEVKNPDGTYFVVSSITEINESRKHKFSLDFYKLAPMHDEKNKTYYLQKLFKSFNLGKVDEDGMIIDLGKVKELANIVIDPMDHAFAYNKNTTDPYEREVIELELKWNKRVVAFETRTTAEEMSEYILRSINKLLEEKGLYPTVKCSEIQLYETATGCANYKLED